MLIRAATDVGGTFTDLVFYGIDPTTGRCGEVRTAKVDTTPGEFEKGVMNSLAKGEVNPAELGFFAHGATVVINAITERKGAKVALLTTKGFRDVLEIARGNRPDLFNFDFRKPAPFVARHLRHEVTERCDFKGNMQIVAELDGLPETVEYFKQQGVQAVAICFLHAYLNSANEERVARRVRELWPEVSLVASHELSREWREYERTSTTVLSAYVHPIVLRYIDRLEREFQAGGFEHPLHMMLSNGGIATATMAKANPVSMVESGPASGIYASAHIGALIGEPNLIVLDIGGTTAKCALIDNGEVKITTQYSVERTRTTPGYPIQTPVAEIVEIGNGGGSIAWVDVGGKLHVGPQSAGAMPGPVAYGRGGTLPTTTDANLLLGRIDPKSFAGGEINPDWVGVQGAFETLGAQLGISAVEAARGVVRIANSNMANALRLVSTNKGYDPREFALIAFGGGGAMHAVALAEELKVPKVIVPVNSAVFSAWGMLLTDLRRDYVRTHVMSLEPASAAEVARQFDAMASKALADFAADGAANAASDTRFEYLADMRYQGQEHTVKVPLTVQGGQADIAQARESFHALHLKRFTYQLPNRIHIVNFHLVARVPVPKPELPHKPVTGRELAAARVTTRRVDFDAHGIVEADIYDGLLLEPGMRFQGPAIVQEPVVTLVVPPYCEVEIDVFGNYHVHLGALSGANHS